MCGLFRKYYGNHGASSGFQTSRAPMFPSFMTIPASVSDELPALGFLAERTTDDRDFPAIFGKYLRHSSGKTPHRHLGGDFRKWCTELKKRQVWPQTLPAFRSGFFFFDSLMPSDEWITSSGTHGRHTPSCPRRCSRAPSSSPWPPACRDPGCKRCPRHGTCLFPEPTGIREPSI